MGGRTNIRETAVTVPTLSSAQWFDGKIVLRALSVSAHQMRLEMNVAFDHGQAHHAPHAGILVHVRLNGHEHLPVMLCPPDELEGCIDLRKVLTSRDVLEVRADVEAKI
jgi:hypothetical protein